jgi:hypothetical protein
MQNPDVLWTLLIGAGLRFVIPIGLTSLLVWWLRRLDVRWQAESRQQQVRVINASEIARSPRCWEVRNCPPERMAECLAHNRPDAPCWQIFRDEDGNLRTACLSCPVFRNAVAPQFA